MMRDKGEGYTGTAAFLKLTYFSPFFFISPVSRCCGGQKNYDTSKFPMLCSVSSDLKGQVFHD